ncbi:coenzyme F420-0:L-glutamate ligase [Arvimicrobium flavum]|uniref:coenzyme F420-0:L-glutamate ligase n=1 Tax=Arvimicrobium flavum TaxID=3393320 RepID=UPI00237B429D|nr:coenzyme F420-0:L-glutamate ligase [Mesorhizobium shangrilense]
MTVAVAILMKDPTDAKSRLNSALGDDARERLALLLFENTLRFFLRVHAGKPIGVVTSSGRVGMLATQQGATVIADRPGGDINAAATYAVDWANGIGAASLLIIHADIPTLVDDELSCLLRAGERRSVIIGASRDGGTNAMLLTPPDAIPFHYGSGSARSHQSAARKLGRSCERLLLPHLSRDIDTPNDLAAHLASGAARPPAPGSVTAFAVAGVPEIEAGDDIGRLIADALSRIGVSLHRHDIVVVAQKVVSKSEGRLFAEAAFHPSERALELAEAIGKNPGKVEAILSESSEVLRARRQPPDGLLITRHRHGWICANAGIDESNLGDGREGILLLLPEDPDASARAIRASLETRFGDPIGVIVSDTFGRPWRNGLVNIAIGVAGVPALVDWAGRQDAYGRDLKATLPAFADEVAAATGLLMPKDAGLPVVVIRGLDWTDTPTASARDVLRPLDQELFR